MNRLRLRQLWAGVSVLFFWGTVHTSGQSPVVSALDAATPADTTPSAPKFEAVWNNGLFIQTEKKDFVMHVGGVLHLDAAWYSGSEGLQRLPGGIGQLNDGVVPRRTRIFFEGTAYEHFDFFVNYELANGIGPIGTAAATTSNIAFSPGLLDAWVTINDVPGIGNIRIGNQKEWFSLEHLNSARFLEFIERSYLFDASQPTAFNNGRSPGVSMFRSWGNDRVFTGLGFYKNQSELFAFGVGDGEYAVTGRVATMLIHDKEAEQLWSVGGAMSHRDPANDQVRVRVRNAARGSPGPLLNLVVDTGALAADSQNLFNLETAAVRGPLTFQAEYRANVIHGARPLAGGIPNTVVFQGAYAEAMVFLTGESRSWNPKTATFNRVIPNRNFMSAGGLGAIELGIRYSYLDATEETIRGGRLHGVTLGLNWYWNPNMKCQINYDYCYRDQASNPLAQGSIHSLVTRLAFDF
ncbi:MAG: OprO/OprP family phosphate-selective porin [Fimbriiglobus sp.]